MTANEFATSSKLRDCLKNNLEFSGGFLRQIKYHSVWKTYVTNFWETIFWGDHPGESLALRWGGGGSIFLYRFIKLTVKCTANRKFLNENAQYTWSLHKWIMDPIFSIQDISWLGISIVNRNS